MLGQLYKSLVRGHLEYANTVWCPSKKANIDHLERVQRRATKLVPELKELPYPERLKQMKLPSLVYRRKRGDMIETYKILNGLVDTIGGAPLQLAEECCKRSHSLKLKKNHCRTALRQNTFSQRVVNSWNALPEKIVKAPNLNTFKNLLDRHWSNHPCLYHYKTNY